MELKPVFVFGEQEFNLLCDKKCFEVMHTAIKKNKLPSRTNHAAKALECLFREPFSIVGRVAELGFNLIQLLLFPLFYDNKYAKADYTFRICRILFLDPLAVLMGVISSTTRLIFCFIGIISPKVAAYGWIGAQYVASVNHRLQGVVWKNLIYNLHRSSHNKKNFFPIPIKANLAKRYLGSEITKSIIDVLKIGQKDELDENIKKSFKVWLTIIESSSSTCMPNAIAHAAYHYKILPIVKKLEKESDETYAAKAYELLSIEEIKIFHRYLVSFIKRSEPNLRIDPDYQKKGLLVYDALNFRLKLGAARIITYRLRAKSI